MNKFRQSFMNFLGRSPRRVIVDADRWGTKPISKPAQAPWDLTISHQDLQRFLQGSTPRDMDDRWLCETTGPDKGGEYLVNLIRSWSGLTIIAIKVRAQLDEQGTPLPDQPVRIHELLWETDEENYNSPAATKESMQEMARNLCKGLVQVDLSGGN